jgi:prepilin signal peptidase PulO-like enzyme (type II secretory pathway)
VNAGLTVAAGAVGAAAGMAAGWLNVTLERLERLEEEENQERVQYEAQVARDVEVARTREEDSPPAPPWQPERYGWTWLEQTIAPALGAFGFALFAGREGLTLGMLEHLLWIAVFVHIITFDLKHRLILNRITYPGIVLAIVLAAITPGLSLQRALLGGAVIAAFFLLISVLSRGGIGLGDAKLGALIGAITGLSFDSVDHLQAVNAIIAAIFLGGGVALLLLVTRVRGLKDPIPYGPFLCAGAALVLYQTT